MPREKSQPAGCLAAGALQFVVKQRIFEESQIQPVGVMH